MIKIETVNTDNRYVRIEGTSKLVCTELMIVITKMIENNMLSDADRDVIKLVTGLDRDGAIEAQQMLKDSLHLKSRDNYKGGTNND